MGVIFVRLVGRLGLVGEWLVAESGYARNDDPVILDVEHGACAMLRHTLNGIAGRLAMIDSAIKMGADLFINQAAWKINLSPLFVQSTKQRKSVSICLQTKHPPKFSTMMH
jgi:hypothetical protein